MIAATAAGTKPGSRHPLAVFGLGGLWPEMRYERREAIIAINFGGCVIPTGLALYELLQLSAQGTAALLAVLVAGVVNISVCYFLARPVEGVGIRWRSSSAGSSISR
jgi:uncharacterized membrane protein